MKTTIFLLLFMVLYVNNSYAINYIIDINNNVIAKINYEPNLDELSARQETLVRSDLDLNLQEAEYRGNKIVKRVKTSDEVKEDSDEVERNEELRLITRRANKIAYEELKAEGVIFKHFNDQSFD